MDYRDILEPASFRGVPFSAAVGDTAVGRRVVVHEYPKRNRPFPEDMGRAASEFVVDGMIVGDDYIAGRNRLMRALMQEGPGTLVHPTFGELQVVLLNKPRLREQFIEQRGRVTFSLTFVEDGSQEQPIAQIDTQLAVDAACDAAHDACEDDFAQDFSTEGAPGWSLDAITDEINAAAATIADLRKRLSFDLSALTRLVRAGNQFKANLTALLALPNALATELGALVRGVVGWFDFSLAQQSIFGESSSVRRPLDALLGLRSYGATRSSVRGTTPSRLQQAGNQHAVATLVARAAVIEAVRASIYVPFASHDEAVTLRTTLYDALEELILDAPDAVYRVMLDLRGAMVRDITERGADLASLSSLTLPASMPASVLSYRLYGSTAFGAEIVERNQAPASVLHPLFVPAGVVLEVRRV